MKERISPQEHRLLAVIIFSGFCANPRYPHSPEYDIPDAVRLLDKLLSAIEVAREVESVKEREQLENERGENAL